MISVVYLYRDIKNKSVLIIFLHHLLTHERESEIFLHNNYLFFGVGIDLQGDSQWEEVGRSQGKLLNLATALRVSSSGTVILTAQRSPISFGRIYTKYRCNQL